MSEKKTRRKKKEVPKEDPPAKPLTYCELCKQHFKQDLNTSMHYYQAKHLKKVYKAIADSEGPDSTSYEYYYKYLHNPGNRKNVKD